MAAGNDSGSRKGKGVSGNHGASSECSHSGGGSGIQEHHRRPPQEQKESTPFGESICMARIPGKVVDRLSRNESDVSRSFTNLGTGFVGAKDI
jgi:hypothetical protein